jgi:uncharacterized protein YggT (Ycf19 family)
MITDFVGQFILLFTRLLALLFLLKALGLFLANPDLGGLLRPFNSFMNPMLEKVRAQFLAGRIGFDFSPLIVAIFILLVGSLLARIF